jgi:hypothetical protein
MFQTFRRHVRGARCLRIALLCCTNETDSLGKLIRRKEIENAIAGDTGEDRGRDPDLEKHKLGRRMSVRADRDPSAFSGDEPQALHIEVLSVRVRVDFERGAGLDRMASDPLPITAEAGAKVVDALARMGEDLYVWILEAISSIVELPSVSSVCIW